MRIAVTLITETTTHYCCMPECHNATEAPHSTAPTCSVLFPLPAHKHTHPAIHSPNSLSFLPPFPPVGAAQLSCQAATHIASRPRTYPPAPLLPSVIATLASRLGAAAVARMPAAHALLQRSVAVQRAQQPPRPPRQDDWARPEAAEQLRCGAQRCRNCTAIQGYLRDGAQQQLKLTVTKSETKHVD